MGQGSICWETCQSQTWSRSEATSISWTHSLLFALYLKNKAVLKSAERFLRTTRSWETFKFQPCAHLISHEWGSKKLETPCIIIVPRIIVLTSSFGITGSLSYEQTTRSKVELQVFTDQKSSLLSACSRDPTQGVPQIRLPLRPPAQSVVLLSLRDIGRMKIRKFLLQRDTFRNTMYFQANHLLISPDAKLTVALICNN